MAARNKTFSSLIHYLLFPCKTEIFNSINLMINCAIFGFAFVVSEHEDMKNGESEKAKVLPALEHISFR